MEIHIQPKQFQDPGKETAIPARLQSHLVAWATPQYREYDAGALLVQSFRYKRYHLYLTHFLLQAPAGFYLTCDAATLALQFTLSEGPAEQLQQLLPPPGHYRLAHLPAGSQTIFLRPGQHECLHITLEPTALEELTESRPEIKALLAQHYAGIRKAKYLPPIPIDFMAQAIINDLRHSNETAGDLLMEAKAAISNLLNLYRKELQDNTPCKALLPGIHADKLSQIRQEIKRQPNIRLHTNAYFAQKYNLSTSTLKRLFKAAFAKPLHRYVTEECIKKALWLMKNPAFSTEDIATELGYIDKSGFIKAFKKHNGKVLGGSQK